MAEQPSSQAGAPSTPTSEEVAKGLNSSEIRTNKDIPFADDGDNELIVALLSDQPKTICDQTVQLIDIEARSLSQTPMISVTDTTKSPPSSSTYRSRPDSPRPRNSGEDSIEMIEVERDADEEMNRRKAGLRRNSISMPTLQNLELEVLRQQYLNNPDQISHFNDDLTVASPTRELILPSNRRTPCEIPFVDENPDELGIRTSDVDSRISSPIYMKISSEDEMSLATSSQTSQGDVSEYKSQDDTKSVGTTVSEIMRETGERGGQMKRNSISMPNHLQYYELEMLRRMYLQRIPEHHQSTGSAFGDEEGLAGVRPGESKEILTDDEREKSPIRNGRRKAGGAGGLRRAGRSEIAMELGTDEDYSPVNSITSINSLASLLREKIHSIPQKMRKKPADYKLRAFVGLMFLAIVFFVGFAYVMYHQQVLAKQYFDSIKFNKAQRMIRVYHQRDKQEILKGKLAINIDDENKAYPCLPEHRRSDGSICLEWMNSLRFYLNYLPHDPGMDNTTCYSIKWKALSEGVMATDCFDWSENKQHWYGGGQSVNFTWPLELGSQDFAPFITGDNKKQQWGNALTRYFINSKGAAIIVDDDIPLYVSINRDNDKQLCIQARHDNFAFVNHQTNFPELRYNICTSHNMKSLHSSIHSHQRTPLWDGLKPEDMATLDSLISEPVWQIAPRIKNELTEATVYNYTEDVIDLGFLKQGHVLINEYWQEQVGDFTLDTSRFETLEQTVNVLHRRGFKIVFSIQPYVSTESKNFAECVQKRILISERFSDLRIPALTRYKSLSSAGVLDITNNRTIPWLHDKLRALVDKYKIDSFFLDLGTAYDLPHYYRCENQLVNPDQYKTLFTRSFERTLSVIGVSGAVSLPRPPVFVSLPPLESTWEAIRLVIPTMLTYGIIGYPFLMPGAVGGDIYWPGSEQYIPTYPRSASTANSSTTTQENGIALPERELYMRWLQLATFLPVMKFTHLPSKYNDGRVLELAKYLTAVRQKTVTPLLLKYKREALEEGLPLVRPLWLVAPGDAAALTVDDEFAVGDEIIVAPILYQGALTREVYLPAGVWKDGIDSSLRKGSRWIHDYKVPVDKVAFFVKMPDNTRF